MPDAPAGRRAAIVARELTPLLPELLPGLMFTGQTQSPICTERHWYTSQTMQQLCIVFHVVQRLFFVPVPYHPCVL